jgi:D-arabinose 1-dehydrogenase-like Zn-dependent alcohol dehydrogenase
LLSQVPGHEIVGIVREVGSGVTKFKVQAMILKFCLLFILVFGLFCVFEHDTTTCLSNKVLFEQVGDRVGVGCIVDSCRECAHCSKGLEQYCGKGMTGTYNSQVEP